MNNAIGSGLFMSRQVRWYVVNDAAAISAAVQLPALVLAQDRSSRSDGYAEPPSVHTKQRPIPPPGIFSDAVRKLVSLHANAPAVQVLPSGWMWGHRHYGIVPAGEMTTMLQNQIQERRDPRRRRPRLGSRTHQGGPPGRAAQRNATVALGMGVNRRMAGAIRTGIA